MTSVSTPTRPPAPTPLPTETIGYPQAWKDQTLATFSYTAQPGKLLQGSVTKATFASTNKGDFHAAGTSFTKAVKLANTKAIGSTANQAQAILQAKNGAYWVVGLGDSTSNDMIDGTAFKAGRHIQSVIVDKVHVDLQAVVGASSWVNFSDKELPKSFTFGTPA